MNTTTPGPIAIEVEAGKNYFWCTCARSQTQPFCDGSHQGTGARPLPWSAEKSGTQWFCGCKKTRTPPLCDGSHQRDETAG